MTRTHNRLPRADQICGAWVPTTRTPQGGHWRADMLPRHVCHRLHHPGDPRHITADNQWMWTTGDQTAQPTHRPTRRPPAANPTSRVNPGAHP